MRRLRLKADGRIVEIRDGQEAPLVPDLPRDEIMPYLAKPSLLKPCPQVRALRLRASLTQAQFAARLGIPVETIRNWEQGKRNPRGPAKALLTLIAHAPDLAYAVLDETGPAR